MLIRDSMDDELEDKLIYQTFVTHTKLLSKFIMGISVNSTYLGYSWRMFRIYALKPEILIFSVLVLLVIAYLQNVDIRSQSFFKKLGLSIGESSTFKNIQLKSRADNSSWEYKAGNVAVFAVQGRRPHMEDRFVINENIKNTGVSLFAVFDGHGGDVSITLLPYFFSFITVFILGTIFHYSLPPNMPLKI